MSRHVHWTVLCDFSIDITCMMVYKVCFNAVFSNAIIPFESKIE